MRAAEQRWRRAFGRIILASLAACHAGSSSSEDASTEADVEPEDDGACRSSVVDAAADAEDCSFLVALPCGLPDGTTVAQCYPNLGACAVICQTNDILFCDLPPSSCAPDGGVIEGPAIVECSACGVGGRRPRGLHPRASCARSELGDFFARMAHLERASVPAFAMLSRSLASFGAPRRLVAAANEAARDERRHARSMGRLARRFGGRVSRVRIDRRAEPTLFSFLEGNAIEGCAGETFAALVATWQTAHARDARTRATMGRIARDETRHAALAWEVLAWGLPKLPAAQRRLVRRRLDAALVECGRGGALSLSSRRTIGYPEPAMARALAENLRARVRAGASPTTPSRRRSRR